MASIRSPQDVDGVGVAHIERIFALLREKLPRVLEANRYFEEQTGIHNQAGSNNIVDAFSHLATLVEHAHDLDDFAQSEQVAQLEDHLRRSMMEAFEQVVKLRLADVAERWEEHRRVARPLQMRGKLPGSAPPEKLQSLRIRLKQLLDGGRESKRAVTWEEWENGTDLLVQACDVSELLLERLEDGIAAARFVSRHRRNLWVAAAGAFVALVIGLAVGASLLG